MDGFSRPVDSPFGEDRSLESDGLGIPVIIDVEPVGFDALRIIGGGQGGVVPEAGEDPLAGLAPVVCRAQPEALPARGFDPAVRPRPARPEGPVAVVADFDFGVRRGLPRFSGPKPRSTLFSGENLPEIPSSVSWRNVFGYRIHSSSEYVSTSRKTKPWPSGSMSRRAIGTNPRSLRGQFQRQGPVVGIESGERPVGFPAGKNLRRVEQGNDLFRRHPGGPDPDFGRVDGEQRDTSVRRRIPRPRRRSSTGRRGAGRRS